MADQKDYAVIITAQEQAELQAVERDSRPLGPDEVAGSSIVTLISAGTELAGTYTAESGFPRRSGYAAIFKVEDVGGEVKNVKEGDLAFCMGNHRSYQRANASGVLPLPEGLKPETGVFARMMGVSMSTLTTTTARPPEMVLVTRAGCCRQPRRSEFC